MIIVLQVLAFLAVLLVIGYVLNLGMFFLAEKLDWFTIKPIPERWYDKYVSQIQYRLWNRWELEA